MGDSIFRNRLPFRPWGERIGRILDEEREALLAEKKSSATKRGRKRGVVDTRRPKKR